MINERVLQTAKVFLRLSLSAAFLSAIGDRSCPCDSRFGGRFRARLIRFGEYPS